MEIKKYPDGTSYIELPSHSAPQSFTFRINSYEDLWHLNQVVDAYNHIDIRPQITIPNLIDAQADRRFDNNQSSGLKLVCGFLNNMEADFTIFHPHNAEVVEALMDNVEIIDNSEFIGKRVLNLLNCNPYLKEQEKNQQNLILMSSDAGGFKPLMKLCDKLNWKGETSSASKSRSYENGKSELTQLIGKSDFQGKDILIVDDICVYGGTFKGLAKQLKTHNCGKLYLAVSHMIVQDLGNDPVTNYFDTVFTTNSKYDYYTTINNLKGVTGTHPRQPANLKIIKLF